MSLGGNQMSNFKTHGEASQYCIKYGFKVPGNINAFEIAEALLRAYKDGTKEHSKYKSSYECDICHPKNR